MVHEGKFFAISIDDLNETQLLLVQANIRETAASWWHQHETLWIVQGGENAGFWRDLLTPLTRGIGGTLLVLRLPQRDGRNWASRGVEVSWLKETYTPERPLQQ